MKLPNFIKKHKDILAYLFFGGVTTLVNLAVYAVCYDLCRLPNMLSTILAWVLSVLVAFLTNKPWVFGSHDWRAKTLLREAGSFFGCCLLTGLLDLLIMFLAVDLWHLPGTPMKIASNVLVIILNYVFSKWLIFKKN